MNFIDMISTSVNDFELFGNSDVRYKIEGGSQRLIKSIREKISGSIIFNKTLKSVKSNDKEVKVEFADGSSIIADHLILAIPFSTLRRVELAINGMTEQKLYCVENLGYGRNCKIILSTKSRDWRGDGSAGNIINEVLQNGWDSTQCQSNNVGPGSYTIYLGAPIADIFNNSGIRKVTDLKAKFISIINRLFPSTTSIFQANLDWLRGQIKLKPLEAIRATRLVNGVPWLDMKLPRSEEFTLQAITPAIVFRGI